jgi:hypothetical protein
MFSEKKLVFKLLFVILKKIKSIMTHKEGLQQNRVFFTQLINSLNEGGIWVFPAINQIYYKKNGKLMSGSRFAYDTIRNITPKDIHNLFGLDLTIQCPQLN